MCHWKASSFYHIQAVYLSKYSEAEILNLKLYECFLLCHCHFVWFFFSCFFFSLTVAHSFVYIRICKYIYIYINVEIFQTVINLCAFLRICETIILLFVEKEYWVQLNYYIISQENIIFSGQATYISLVQQQGNYCH